MYRTINDIKGKKTIDLSYPIRSSKEVAVISMLNENTQYEMKKPLKLKLVDGSEKEVLNKTYTSRELNAFVDGKHIISYLDNDPQIIKTNKLVKVTNMIFKLDELDNTNNLEDGNPATPYLHIISLVLKILRVSNQPPPPPPPPNIRDLKWRDCFLNTDKNNRPK